MIRVLFLLIICLQPSLAYLDTTPKNFSKPKPMVVKPYTYVRPKHEVYMDQAAEKIAPRVFSSVVGPAGMMINVAGKAVEAQEKGQSSNSQGFNSK